MCTMGPRADETDARRRTGYASAVEMRWRVRLAGAAPDLAHLRRELATGDVLAREDDEGTYLQAASLESFDDVFEVIEASQTLIEQLKGITSLTGSQPVGFSGRVDRDESTWVFGYDAGLAVEVSLIVDGVVTGADGAVKSSSGPSVTTRRLQAAQASPVLAEVYRILALRSSPSWTELYKVYEVLREASGGKDRDLAAHTGVSEGRIGGLKANANHQLLSGDESRHATMKGTPSAEYKITTEEGKAIVKELIDGFAESCGV